MPTFSAELSPSSSAPAPFTLTRPSDVGRTIGRGLAQVGEAVTGAQERGEQREANEQLAEVVNRLDTELGLNEEIKDGFTTIENRQKALNQGRITRTQYVRQLDAEVRKLKKNNPGQEMFIDARARQLLGQDPRIALRNLALEGEQDRDSLERQVVTDAIRDGVAVIENGVVNSTATVDRVMKLNNLRAESQLVENQIKRMNAKLGGSGTTGSRSGSVRSEMQPHMDSMVLLLSKEFVNRTDQVATQIASIPNPSPDIVNTIVFGDDTTKGALTQLDDVRQEMLERLSESGLNFSERQEVIDYMEDNYFKPYRDALTDKDFGLIGRQARLNKALEENVVNNLYQTAPTIAALRVVGGEAYANKFVDSLDPELLATTNREGSAWLRAVSRRMEGQGGTLDNLSPNERRAAGRLGYKQVRGLANISLDAKSLNGFMHSLEDVADTSDTFLSDPSKVRQAVNELATPAVRDKLLKGRQQNADLANKGGEFVLRTVLSEFNSVASATPPEQKIKDATLSFQVNDTTGDYFIRVSDGKNNVDLTEADMRGNVSLNAINKVTKSGLNDKARNSVVRITEGHGNVPPRRFFDFGRYSPNALIRMNQLRRKINDFKEFDNSSLLGLAPNASNVGIARLLAQGNNLLPEKKGQEVARSVGGVPIPLPDETVAVGESRPSEIRDAQGIPIDLSRPRLQRSGGRVATEESITVTEESLNKGRPTNIPTIWNGKKVSDEKAIELAVTSGQKFPSFKTIEEAESAAQARSDLIGELISREEQ
jgi:hypothetical protein